MRRMIRVFALAVLALGATALSAQAQKKTMGLLAGVDFATINGSDISDGTGTRTGFQGGLFFGIPLGSGGWAVEPEALYSMQGATYDNSAFKGTYAVDYIKIPILFKWSKNPGGKGIYAMAGPTIGFNVSCNDSGDDKLSSTSYDGSCENEDNVKAKTTWSGDLGLGFSNGRFGIEGRYSFDWGDAFEVANGVGAGTSLDAKNSVWSILVRFSK